MIKYMALFKVRYIGGLQYRSAAIGGICTQFAWGGLSLLAFSAFYRSNPGAYSMEFPALASYVWLQQAFLMLFAPWLLDRDILNTIQNGQLAYELVRPLNLYNKWFFESFANRFSKATLRCLPVLLVSLVLSPPFNLSLPSSPLILLTFVFSMVLSASVICAYNLIFYVLTLKTLNSAGLFLASGLIADFFSGSYIPIPFFPDKIKRVVELLPFASMQNTPLRIYSGDISGSEIITRILLQIFWLTILILIDKILMKRALKKAVVQGG